MPRQTHFEVMVMQGGNWQIHARFGAHQKEAAVEEAKVLDNTSGIGQVKVIKDVYDPEEGLSEEYIIYKTSPRGAGGGADGDDDWGPPSGGGGGVDDWDWDEAGQEEDDSGPSFWSKLKENKKSKKKSAKAKKAAAKAKAAAAFAGAGSEADGQSARPQRPHKQPSSTPVVLVKILLVAFFGVMIGIIIALTGQYAMEQMAVAGVVKLSKNMQANLMFVLFVIGFLGSAIPMAMKFMKDDAVATGQGGWLTALFRRRAQGRMRPRRQRGPGSGQQKRSPMAPTENLEELSSDEALDKALDHLEEPEEEPVIAEEILPEEEEAEDETPAEEDDDATMPPHAKEQRAYMRGFIDKVLTDSSADKTQMDNFNKFGTNLFLAGACEVLATKRNLDEGSAGNILSETVQTMGFKKEHAESFSDKYQEYLMADSRYMQMFQAGRNAMNTFFTDEGEAPKHLDKALADWNKPKEKEDNAGPVTVMFTDMVGSTSLTQRLGDHGAQKVVRAHNRVVREALTQTGGREVKHTGDGIMASFPTTSNSVECAILIQKGTLKHNVDNPDLPLGVKIGINAGEPIQEDNDLFGTTVQLAARIVDKAGNYEIFVSEIVRGICAGGTMQFQNRGQYEMKGVKDKMTLYEVVWRDAKDTEMQTMIDARTSQGAA